jgi:hypothetical protein
MFLRLLVICMIDSHLLIFLRRKALDHNVQTILTMSAYVTVKRSVGDVLRDTDNYIKCCWSKYSQNYVILSTYPNVKQYPSKNIVLHFVRRNVFLRREVYGVIMYKRLVLRTYEPVNGFYLSSVWTSVNWNEIHLYVINMEAYECVSCEKW